MSHSKLYDWLQHVHWCSLGMQISKVSLLSTVSQGMGKCSALKLRMALMNLCQCLMMAFIKSAGNAFVIGAAP